MTCTPAIYLKLLYVSFYVLCITNALLLHLCVHVLFGRWHTEVQYVRLKKFMCALRAILCDDRIITVCVVTPISLAS